jgi:hypothetical protein
MIKCKKSKLIGTGAIFGTMAVVGTALAIGKKIRKNKMQKLLENEKYSTGNTRKFGTLYLDNEKQKIPVDFLEFQDVPVYAGQKIEIRDTHKSNDSKLSWIEINDNDKRLLVCDRNILKEVSWDELNEQNLIFGKVVIIEGKKYILRLLTGYSEKNDNKHNEWDRYIVNVANIVGLPTSTDCDIENISNEDNEDKINKDNNSLWHWYNFSSFTQNEYSKNRKFCIIRGLYSTTYSNQSEKELKYETVGYRPVLELIE